MAVDYQPNLDGRDPNAKIGVITPATIEGNALLIEGFIYAADFPEVAAEIKAGQDALGLSYEARNLYTNDPDANPCVITDCRRQRTLGKTSPRTARRVLRLRPNFSPRGLPSLIALARILFWGFESSFTQVQTPQAARSTRRSRRPSPGWWGP
jgi:hypothetical protein